MVFKIKKIIAFNVSTCCLFQDSFIYNNLYQIGLENVIRKEDNVSDIQKKWLLLFVNLTAG